MIVLYSDCIVLGKNPSDTGGGYLLCDSDGEIIEKEIIYKKGFTNNEGELLGVLRATELVDSHGTVYTDSMNTIKWIKAGSSKARPDLSSLMARAKKNIILKSINLVWINRYSNKAGLILDNMPIK